MQLGAKENSRRIFPAKEGPRLSVSSPTQPLVCEVIYTHGQGHCYTAKYLKHTLNIIVRKHLSAHLIMSKKN